MSPFGFGPDTDRLSALYRYCVLDGVHGEAFDAVTRDVSVAFGGMSVQIVLVDDHRLVTLAQAGPMLDEGPKAGALSAALIEQTEPLVVDDAQCHAIFSTATFVLQHPNIRAYAGVCLRTPDQQSIGVLAALDTKPRVFRPPHVALLEHAATRVVELLEARRQDQRDPATSAMTAAAFHEQVTQLAGVAARHRRDLSLLVLEIDPLRTLLESFKVDLGRLLIDRMGGLGRTDVRRIDSFGRLSDSRFAVLLPDTNAAGAIRLAARIVEKLAEGWSFPAPLGVDTTPVGVGVATLRPGLDTAADLAARALAECDQSSLDRGVALRPVMDARVA